MPHTFTASFPGRCASCNDRIEPGDEIGYVDDEVCCETCVDAADD